MTRRAQAPDIKHGTGPLGKGTTETHPAFGQIAASRVSGATNLYGSDFVHHNFIEITLRRSELNRDLSHDWHFATDELISVRLSEAQWATFVSTLNGGRGIPCTLNYVMSEQMPDIQMEPRTDLFKQEADAKIAEMTKSIDEAIRHVDEELGSSVSGKKKEALLGILRHARMNVSSNVPFVAKSLAEHMENTVEKAKVEVHAYMENAIRSAGFAALTGNGPLQLSVPKDDADSGE